FSEMHDAHTVVQARCLELKTELSNLKDKIQKDDHDVMETRSEADRTLVYRALDFQIIQLTKKVSVLQEQSELFRVENAKVKQHYKELYDIIKIARAKHIDQTTTLLTENENLKVQINEKLKCVAIDSVTPKVLALGVDSCTDASGSKPRRNTKKNKISPAKSVTKKTVEDHSRTNKSHLKKLNRVDSSISSNRTICKTCNKCFISANHDMCVIKYLNSMNAPSFTKIVVSKVKQVYKPKQVKKVWKATGIVLTTVGYHWKPTGRIFTLGEQCPLTRFTHPKVVPIKQPKNVSTSKSVITENLSHTSQKPLTRYQHRNK
nr:hypothetical protein [Tanacetum cinerariifolium]